MNPNPQAALPSDAIRQPGPCSKLSALYTIFFAKPASARADHFIEHTCMFHRSIEKLYTIIASSSIAHGLYLFVFSHDRIRKV
jgi:hypothetical protein